MIGQKILLETINKMTLENCPRFIIITGQKGQGKTELILEISKKLGISFINFKTSIDEMREMIDLAYKQTEPILFIISNADNMSLNAKNSILKLVEEPPNNIIVIIELEDINNTLPTIKSRCLELQMENYTEEEIEEMINKIIPNITELQKAILLDCCQNYYQIELLNKYGIEEFYKYVEKVVNNIYKVQSANSFKITEKLDIKGGGNGYDLNLFFNIFNNISFNYAYDLMKKEGVIKDYHNYLENILITSKYQQKLKINRNK